MTLLPVIEAQARLLALATPVAIERIALMNVAGRWAAGDIVARRTQPSTDLSAMDGYALRHADLPGPWQVVGESAAGRPFSGHVGVGEATRIFTGATMPSGADTVLVQEEALRDGPILTLTGEGPRKNGSNVRTAGLDFDEGDVLIDIGERMTPARTALAAIAGHGAIDVRRVVRVAIAATGDELVRAGTTLEIGQLPESNGLMLAAMIVGLPVQVIDLGILPDDMTTLTAAFRAVDADILVTTGGASVGTHDLVRPALEAAGAVIDFWRIALRPGKPMMAGRMRDTIVLGLPGNPVSAFVTAALFLNPLIAKLSGARDPYPLAIRVPLGEALPANGARTDYLRGRIENGQAYASNIQDSSMLRTLARSNCLIMRPVDAAPAQAGDSAQVLMIG